MFRISSIRQMLIIWVLLPSFLIWFGASFWIYRTARISAETSYDYILSTFLETISYRIMADNGKIHFDFPLNVIPVLRERHIDQRFYQILGPNNELIAGDANLPPPPGYSKAVKLYDGVYKGLPVKIATQEVIAPGTDIKCRIQIVETMAGRYQVGEQTIKSLAFGGLILMLLLIFKSAIAMRLILSPLSKLRDQLLMKSLETIDPLDEKNIPLEIQPLVSAINSLLKKLRSDVDRQKRFVRNAAHQLRTPLSGLKLQTELALRDEALRESSPALLQIKKSIDQTIHLVQRLLSLATSEKAKADRNALKSCDLNQIVRNVTTQLAPLAIKRDIDIGIDSSGGQTILLAEDWAINELMLNILENALLYTPIGGAVTACIRNEDRKIVFQVIDNGCGVPPEERERAFEPFYRLPNSPVGGSGLGLAIVREIASRYDAAVSINSPQNEPGTVVTVEFPI